MTDSWNYLAFAGGVATATCCFLLADWFEKRLTRYNMRVKSDDNDDDPPGFPSYHETRD